MKRSACLLLLVIALAAVPAPDCRAAARVAHVIVALCDNVYQGIVPVPPRLGNGDDPSGNLYWGAAYGVKTFMAKQPGWKPVRTDKNPTSSILERAVFYHDSLGLLLVADAYRGRAIQEATTAFMAYASGKNGLELEGNIKAGGFSPLVVYIGHNGLMDYPLADFTPVKGDGKRFPADFAIFACQSRTFFSEIMRESGSYPLIWTRGNMAPEAYSLHALLAAWAKGEKPEAVREAVAGAYDKYQKCGIKGARNLFATGW